MNNITSIGIIGYGQFGKLIQTLCQHHFPETDIRIFSRRAQVDQVTFFSFEETCKTDIIFPCSPIPYLEQTIDNMQPHLGEKSIVRDVCSIKKHPINILKKHPNTKYIATHPMFGPNSYKTNKTLKGATIAVCDHNLDPEAYQSMISIINTLQLNCITLSADDHDKKLAETLFISHFISQTIVEAGLYRTNIDTLNFQLLMDVVDNIKNDKELFYDIYKYNPYCQQVLKQRETSTQNIKKFLNN